MINIVPHLIAYKFILILHLYSGHNGVPTGINIGANRPDILVHDKKRKIITLIEVGITSQDRLITVEAEKWSKYDVLANKLGSEHKCQTKIIPYVMTWDGMVTKHHRNHSRDIGLSDSVEAYIQTIVLKKTLESISFDYSPSVKLEAVFNDD